MKVETSRGKTPLIGLLTILLCFAGGSIAWASIPGPGSGIRCQGCHTTPGGGVLLEQYAGNQGCINCHSSSDSSTTYELDLGGGPPVETVTVPVVNYTGGTAPSSYLAGGNFYWVQTDGQDDQGHNIFASNPDPLTGAPGLAYGCTYPDSCHVNLHNEMNPVFGFGIRQGCTKCHMLYNGGDPSGSIIGYHHADDSELVVGSSVLDDDGYFRFLDGHILCAAGGYGVCGIEDVDWQATSSSTDHNEYLGNEAFLDSVGLMAGSNPLGHTMTGYCGGCHGNFHQSSPYEAGGDWIRHPAGRVLPSGGEFDDYDTFDPAAPVARPDFIGFTGPESDVDSGVDLANCLSCHRAHGSPYPKMLRWDPTAADACVTCHTVKVSETPGQYHVADVSDCNVCHAAHGKGAAGSYFPNDNEKLVADVITTPNSGDRDVVFAGLEGPWDYADGDETYNGICEVCHEPYDIGPPEAGTKYYNNQAGAEVHPTYTIGEATGGGPGTDCTICHSHDNEFFHCGDPAAGCHGDSASHITHLDGTAKGPAPMDCEECHATSYDADEMAASGACDPCHSPGGAYDGVNDATIGAKNCWNNVYEADGTTLIAGKEKWCAGCHDGVILDAIVVDNPDATFDPDGDWSTLMGHPDGYGSDLRYKAGGTGSATGTWTPDVTTAAKYDVYAWWIGGSSRATNAPYTIHYNGGSETVRVNQKADGTAGKWNLLGTYDFAAGTSGYVVLSDGPGAGGTVAGDAIQLLPADTSQVIVDNPAATFDPDVNWSTLSGYGYKSELRYKAGGTGTATGTWTPDVLEAGRYNVYAWWIGGSSRATNAPYTIYYESGSETVRANQKQSGTSDKWNLLGTYDFAAGTSGYVVLSDGPGADGVVVGDAIRLELTDPSEVIVDNPAAGFDPDGDWSTLVGYGYGYDLRYKAGGTGSATGTWTPEIIEAGDYGVYAWWIGGGSRATNAPYTIYYEGGSETVRVNQKELGTANKWNLLGTYPFAAGTAGYVQLSDGPGADGAVVGDAIRLLGGEGMGIEAPNVIGNDTDYGFYVTGHKIECLVCHDASIEHIDVDHRTYGSSAGNYQEGYRLKPVNGGEPMVLPRPNRGDIYAYLDDFALCGDCHNLYEVLGSDEADVSHTNFWEDDGSPRNGHNRHIGFTGVHVDSDWDWVVDSTGSCITCHNVHGPPNQAMIRHGELMSTYGTTDKVPGLNFCYLTSFPEGCDTEVEVKDSDGSKMAWKGTLVTQNGMCNGGCHGVRKINRDPYIGTSVLSWPKVGPAPNDGSTVVLTAYVLDRDTTTVPSVSIDVSDIDGGPQTMYDDGNTVDHGDEVNGDGIYSCKTTVAVDTPPDLYGLTVTATDADGTSTNDVMLEVYDPDEIIVDNPAATVDPEGAWSTLPGYGYGDDLRYKAEGTGSATVTWTPDVIDAGNYIVYAWWIEGGSRATNAPYTIYYNGGSETIRVNQKESGTGDQWNQLGTGAYNFVAGTSGYVVLSDGPGADGTVVADAIKLEKE